MLKHSGLLQLERRRIWRITTTIRIKIIRGFANSNIKLDRSHTTHPLTHPLTHPPTHPLSNFFGNPSLTYKQNTHGILLQNISNGLGLFWDDFPNKRNPSETWTHPPTSIVNSDFWKKILCKASKKRKIGFALMLLVIQIVRVIPDLEACLLDYSKVGVSLSQTQYFSTDTGSFRLVR